MNVFLVSAAGFWMTTTYAAELLFQLLTWFIRDPRWYQPLHAGQRGLQAAMTGLLLGFLFNDQRGAGALAVGLGLAFYLGEMIPDLGSRWFKPTFDWRRDLVGYIRIPRQTSTLDESSILWMM